MNDNADNKRDERGERPTVASGDAPVDGDGAEREQVEETGSAQTARTEPDAAADAGDRERDERSESEELARMREAMLRLQAEMDNREKRLEREMVKTRKFAVERLVGDLIPVLDSMDQALASGSEDGESAGDEGMQLVRKQTLQVLESHGLQTLDPLGETFDPTWHEAIATQPSEEQPADSVLQVLQRGYRLNDRLVRPARVIVAKAP